MRAFPSLDLDENPLCFSNFYARFDLGGELANGSVERITQSSNRAVQLWQDVFTSSSELTLLIDDWDTSGRELWPSDPPNFLYSLIDDSLVHKSSNHSIDRGEFAHERRFIRCPPTAIDYELMLRSIANREQGMTPRINQTVYCIDLTNQIAFYMYDDRGCLLYFGDQQRCQSIYELRTTWIISGAKPG